MSFIGDLFGGGSQQGTTNTTIVNSDPSGDLGLPTLGLRFNEAGNLFQGTPSFDAGQYLQSNPNALSQIGPGQQFANPYEHFQANQGNNPNQYFSTPNQPGFFPGQITTPFAPETEQALQGTAQRATGADPLLEAGRQNALNTIQGDYTGAVNPQLDQVFSAISNRVTPAVQSRFELAGRGGSGAESGEATRIMADAFAPYAYKDYRSERDAQNQMSLTAPGQFAGQDYANLAALSGVGATREGKTAEGTQEAVQRFNFSQEEDLRRLQQLAAFGGGAGGSSTQTTSQPFFSNPAQSALGTGLAGLSSALMIRDLLG
jgi:hypothetical protein